MLQTPQNTVSSPFPRPLSLVRLGLILQGGSVVDWPRLSISTLGDVNQFLRANEFEPCDERDMARLGSLRDAAVDYLRTEHHYRLPHELLRGDPRDLFAYAAGLKGRRHARNYACMILKTMHTIHHLEARELGQHLAISNVEVGQILEAKVKACVTRMREDGFRIVGFSGGQKTRASLVTKLLAKRETHSAQVHDRVRFRFVVEQPEDLPLVIDEMTRRVIAFNYTVPGQSQNDLVDLDALAGRWGAGDGSEPSSSSGEASKPNEFSGATYRVINFVVDVPLRVPPEVLALRGQAEDLGRVIFSLAEMQFVDAAQARINELGENSHLAYKSRQKRRVRARLEQGDPGWVTELRDGVTEVTPRPTPP
jgi:uncharacterized protein (TIGR04552 family)